MTSLANRIDGLARRFLIALMLLAAAIGSIVPTSAALAQQWVGLRNSMIDIAYVPPGNPGNQATYVLLKESRVLEELSAFLSPLRLPRELQIKTSQCGVVNAFYGRGEGLLICYEYAAFISRMSRTIDLPKGFTRQDVIVGAFVQTVLHEVGHAVFDLLEVPIFGRQEDAADQIAAFVMLNFGKGLARRTLTGSAEFMRAIDTRANAGFSDEHGTPLQRFYNLLCIAYGGQPDNFKDLVEAGMLPKERAARCGREYEQVKLAFAKTIWQHIDADKLEKVQAIEWAKWEAPSMADQLIVFLTSVVGATSFWVLVGVFLLAGWISASMKDLIGQLTTFHLAYFSGRLDRRHWWTYMVAAGSAASAIGFILTLLNGFDLPLPLSAVITGSIYLALALGCYWQALFVIKRLHDRNIRGWWSVFLVAPVLIIWIGVTFEIDVSVPLLLSLIPWIWIVVELGFLRGTRGDNRYGPQGVARNAPAVGPARAAP